MDFSNSAIKKMADGYFELDSTEKEYLQHIVWDGVMQTRESFVYKDLELSARDLYRDLITYWEKEENYPICQLIKDSAQRYEIDIDLI